MSKAKAIGTAAETAVVKYLSEKCGIPDVTRIVLHGRDDEGDIHVGNPDFPKMVIEVKSRKNEATYSEVEGFMKELEAEAINTWGEDWRGLRTPLSAFLVIKRPGKGKPEDWWLCWRTLQGVTVRCRLGDYFKPKGE